jgi:DNA-binding CsgD family transcriptional regulator
MVPPTVAINARGFGQRMDANLFTRRATAPSGPVAPPLVERDAELTAIAMALDAALEGAGRALVLDGEAGAGKTRLLAEADALAEERRMSRLRARGTELERGFPFGAMRQLMERRVAELSETERDELLAGTAAPASELLRDAPLADVPPRDISFALVHGLYWVCARLAEREPIVVLVDDFHWLDGPSAQALAYLIERVDELAIAVVLAVRTGVADPLGGVRRLEGASAVEGVTLRPLSELGTGRVLTELLGTHHPSFGATAHRVTAGNPFLLRELALAVASEGIETDDHGARRIAELAPATVTRWALGRLDLLPAAAAAVASSMSVLEQAELSVIATHAGLTLPEAAAAVEGLALAGLVEGRPLRFTHPLVRSALYERVPAAARTLAHRRAAEALRDCGEPAAAVASQLLRSEPRGGRWAVDALRSAAAKAAARGDAGEAVTLLRRAVAELGGAEDEPQLLLELGRAEGALGDQGSAIAHLEAAGAATADAGVRLGARVELAHARYVMGDFGGAFRVGAEVLAEIPAGRGGRLEAELLMSFLMAGRAIPEFLAEVSRLLGQSRLGPGGEVTPAELVRMQTSALDAFLRGRRTDAGRLATEVVGALGAAVPLGEVPTLLPGGVGFVLAGIGEHERAAAVYERALEHALGRGSPLETAEILEGRVSARWWRGDVAGCLADVETILSLVGTEPDPAKLPMRMCQASMLVERGDLEGAEEALGYPDELVGQLRGTWGWLALPFGRARIALARRDWKRALQEAETSGERCAAIAADSPEFLPWRPMAARAALALGKRERALEFAREELRLSRAIGSPRATGVALATLGAIEGRPTTVADAIDELDRGGARLEAARARLELGLFLRRARRPRDARQPLHEALDIAGETGSTVLAELARSELNAAGARPRRERTTGIESLTPRERQIAELAADGLANPEIAERLFISRKTVEAHLRSVFRKLDVKERADLTVMLDT